MNQYSTETERKEVEMFRNIERKAAYELNKENGAGVHTPLLFRVR